MNAIWMQAGLVIAIVILSEAGSSVAGAYDFMIAMGTLSSSLPYLFMFVAWWKIAEDPAAKFGAAVGFVITMSAVLGSMVPSPAASDPMTSTVKLLIATLVMTISGAGFYYAGTRRAQAAILV